MPYHMMPCQYNRQQGEFAQIIHTGCLNLILCMHSRALKRKLWQLVAASVVCSRGDEEAACTVGVKKSEIAVQVCYHTRLV